ncbi:MAG: flagellar hook-length control protein FliK [Rhodobacterales bacterium]|nr:flagellar hook-length control protein FliK [Rhodobacterales bacterium]
MPLPAAQGSHALPTSPLPLPQIAGQLTAALNRSVTGETELALSPAELGHVRLRLKPDTANPDRMVVMITFERPETLDLFRRHAGELADALRSAGYAGADIGFGQQGGESPGSDRQKSFAPAAVDGLSRRNGADADLPAPRQSAGASLDLRL